jgi:hypothetical protein
MAKKHAKRAAHAEHAATKKAAKKHDTPPVRALNTAAEVADQPPLIAVSLATIALGAVLRRPTVLRAGSRMLASHLLATGVKTVFKRSIDRTRPARALADGAHRVGKATGSKDTDLNSFPSGHTAGAVAVAQAVAADLPGAAAPARLAAGAVGAAQLPAGKHYLTDVAAGAAIGWLSEKIASIAVDAADRGLRHVRRRRSDAAAEAEAEAHPS